VVSGSRLVPGTWQAGKVQRDITDRGWDFFVSYTQADRAWAEWIAWQLEEECHRVLIQAWDMVPGANWIHAMHDGVRYASRTIAVLSPAYLTSVYATAEPQSTDALSGLSVFKQVSALIGALDDCTW
jgi:TIR domain